MNQRCRSEQILIEFNSLLVETRKLCLVEIAFPSPNNFDPAPTL